MIFFILITTLIGYLVGGREGAGIGLLVGIAIFALDLWAN